MKKYLKVENHEGLYRDPESGAILNMNQAAFSEYKRKKEELAKQNLEEIRKENEINMMKKDIKEIKDMFQQILEKLNDTN